ncbi:hypothetical protein [Sorangium sp. So ce1151]|uniref:hypothetical protein n=1 Tax=Sorangium sp. So ce1151 TaxID=3133332 RepID=UPI003F6353D4
MEAREARLPLSLRHARDLGEAAARTHTEATLVPAASAVLARYFPLLRLELHRGAGAPGAPEVRRGTGGETVAVFALRDAEGAVGCATMALAGSAALDLTPALLEAVGRLLAVALRQVQVLGRVAAIARRAQGEKRVLREELDRVALPREVVAAGPAMRAIFQEMVPLVARQDTTVLVRGETSGDELVLSAPFTAAPRAKGRVMTYREATQRCIEEALRASGGKVYGEGGAAAALGLKPTTLQSKMRKLGIRREGGEEG